VLTQSASVAQTMGQVDALPLQANGLVHAGEPTLPAAIGAQVPSVAAPSATEHASQGPLQAESQQTPSTHERPVAQARQPLPVQSPG
jgi:hypothetical protein